MSSDAAPGSDPADLEMLQAFLDFHLAEYNNVVRFVMYCGATSHAAEDAAQQALEIGWRKVLRGEWNQVARPQAWIRRVARNCHLSQQRGSGEVPLAAGFDRAEQGPGHAELADQARDLIALLQLLDTECQMVFALRLDGVPGPEIAAELGITPQRERDLYKRARQVLRNNWEGGSQRDDGNATPA